MKQISTPHKNHDSGFCAHHSLQAAGRLICLFLFPVFNFYLLEWYTHNPFTTMKVNVHVMNLILFECIALFLFSLTGRIHTALMIQTLFCAVYGLAGYFVLEFRGAPIQPWDIFSLDTAASVADNYRYKLDREAATALLLFLFLFILEFLIRKWETKRLLWQLRVFGGVFFALLIFGYTKMLHNEEIVQTKLRLYDKLFTPTTIQYKNGTLTAFLMELQYMAVDKPSPYSAQGAQELLEAWEEEAPSAARKPNIIVIMNEAFSDPAILGDFTTNQDYMPFVHSVLEGMENTVSGYLSVSVKGGNTANTEFEYLTGSSMAFLPYGSIPYQQYIKSELPSMASYLSSLGYHTVAMHPYRAAGWDRNLVYPYLGFAEMHFQEFFKDAAQIRKYTSDQGNYEKIIQVYENKPEDMPLFLFNVTMQNHSSYSDWADYDNFTPDIEVDNSSSKLLPAYLSLIRLSDEAIEGLVSYFASQPEDTVIVFFGDHQPTDSVVNPVLKLQGRSCGDLSSEEEALRYQVPFFIWANFDLETKRDVESSANFLGAQTLQAAGLPCPAYFNFLLELQNSVPVISASHVRLSDGTFRYAKDEKERLHDYQTLQYYLLFDR